MIELYSSILLLLVGGLGGFVLCALMATAGEQEEIERLHREVDQLRTIIRNGNKS